MPVDARISQCKPFKPAQASISRAKNPARYKGRAASRKRRSKKSPVLCKQEEQRQRERPVLRSKKGEACTVRTKRAV
eukprot:1161360-Pelagomonas_calceolata.AAC.7